MLTFKIKILFVYLFYLEYYSLFITQHKIYKILIMIYKFIKKERHIFLDML